MPELILNISQGVTGGVFSGRYLNLSLHKKEHNNPIIADAKKTANGMNNGPSC